MTPEQIAGLAAVADIVSRLGTLPIGAIIFAAFICPYIMSWLISRAMEKRFSAVVAMYESNVKLVESHQKMAAEHIDTIRLSTAATTELTTYLQTRTPCHQLVNAQLIGQVNRQKLEPK